MSDGKPEYRSRGFNREAHDRYVSLLLRQMAEAEARTDPAHGEASARGKDHEAFSALLRAGELVEAVAGWAIDHVSGLSLQEENVLPRQPSRSKDRDEYVTSREFADRHEHEKAGGDIGLLQVSLSAAQKRVLLRNLLFGGSMAGPKWLRDEAFQALDALAFGEAVPMLTPDAHTGAKVRYRELRAQLKLVSIVRFREAAYGGAWQAFVFVAEHVGVVSPHTLRTWEKRLRENLGRLEVERAIEFATNHAAHVKQIIDRLNRGFILTQDEVSSREWHERNYGPSALQAAAAEYRKIASEA